MLHLLRTATAASHDRVEAAMPTLDEMATPAGYAATLRALHGFYAVWEPAAWESGAAERLGLGPERRKLPLLERDLQALGIAPAATGPGLVRLDDEGAGVGALYVLEGASLGGRVIYRRVAAPLLLSPQRGGAYYHGHGADTGPRWMEFCRALEGYGEAHGAERAVAGAVACFSALERWLARPGVIAPRAA